MLNKQNLFENEDVSVVLIRKPDCRIQAEVTAHSKLLKEAYQQALKMVSKQISIPGFRKGKAPDSFILKHYPDVIQRELNDIILNMAFRASLPLTHEYPFNKEFFAAQVKSLDLEKGASLFYDYEAMPDIPLVQTEQLEIKTQNIPAVTEADTDNYIDSLITQKAAWHEILDRSAQDNDFVDLDIESIEDHSDGTKNIKKLFNKARVHIAPNNMDAWMRQLVIGQSKGAVIEAMSEDESECNSCETDETHIHSHEFKPTLMRITLLGIFQGELPELNDAFAKQYGADDLNDLKQKVKTYLTNYILNEHNQAQRNQLVQEILTKYPFDVPLSTVNHYISDNSVKIREEMAAKQHSEEDIQLEISRMSERMKQDIRLFFLFQEYIKKHQIEVTQEEIANEWMRQTFMKTAGQAPNLLPEDTEKAMHQIKQQLLREKALDLLIEQKHSQKN